MRKASKYNFKRAMAMLLCVVSLLGLLPTEAFASLTERPPQLSDKEIWPDSIAMLEVKFPYGYAEEDRFVFPDKSYIGDFALSDMNTGSKKTDSSSIVHEFIVDFAGQQQPAFCIDHDKRMGKNCGNKDGSIKFKATDIYWDSNHPAVPLLNYYFTRCDIWGGNPVEQHKNNTYDYTWIQACVWALNYNKGNGGQYDYSGIFDEVRKCNSEGLVDHVMGLTDKGKAAGGWPVVAPLCTRLASYRTACREQFGTTANNAKLTEEDILLIWDIYNGATGGWPQSITNNKFEYRVYAPTEHSCGHWEDDQRLIVPSLPTPDDETIKEGTVYVKKVYEEEGNNNWNTPGGDTPTLYKIDALTGAGIGPATFKFVGEADGTVGIPGSSTGTGNTGGTSGSTSWASGQNPLSGAEFTIVNKATGDIGTMTTDSSGNATFTIPDAWFGGSNTVEVEVKETNAPNNYTLDPYTYTGTVHKNGSFKVNNGLAIVDTPEGVKNNGNPGGDDGPGGPGGDPDNPTPGGNENAGKCGVCGGSVPATSSNEFETCSTCGSKQGYSEGTHNSTLCPVCNASNVLTGREVPFDNCIYAGASHTNKPSLDEWRQEHGIQTGGGQPTPTPTTQHFTCSCGYEEDYQSDNPPTECPICETPTGLSPAAAAATLSLTAYADESGKPFLTIDTTTFEFRKYGSYLGETAPDGADDDTALIVESQDEPVALVLTENQDVETETASVVSYAGPDGFELPLEGTTGWVQKDMTATPLQMPMGTSFVITEVASDGSWKIKTGAGEGVLSKADTEWCMINLPDVLPSIVYNITNASAAIYKSSFKNIPNVTGKKLYTSGKLANPRFGGELMFLAPMNYQCAKKVAVAQQKALAAGKCLVIYDAYRPWSAQEAVKDNLEALMASDPDVMKAIDDGVWDTSSFIATKRSNHQQGIAIDVNLCTVSGTKDVTVGDTTVKIPTNWSGITTPSPMHELSNRGTTFTKPVWSSQSEYKTYLNKGSFEGLYNDTIKNSPVKELQDIMVGSGMMPLASEWWHFDGMLKDTAANVLGASAGEFQVTECLSVAPEKASEAEGKPEEGASGEGTKENEGGTDPVGGNNNTGNNNNNTGNNNNNTGNGNNNTGNNNNNTGNGNGNGTSGSGIPMPPGDVEGSDVARFQTKYFQTDEKGRLSLQWWDPVGENYIAPGQYTVTEYQAPAGWELSTEAQHIVFKWDPKTKLATMSGPLIFKNNRLKKILVEKTDDAGNPIPNVVFNVLKDGKFVGTITTGDSGVAEFNGAGDAGLSEGYYEFEEVSVPLPYVLPAYKNRVQGVHVFPEDINSNDIIKLHFVNYREIDIEILKVDEAGAPLKGAVFEVMINGEKIGEFKTEADGHIVISPEVYGKYVPEEDENWQISVREIKPPDGYLLDDDQWHHAVAHRGRKLVPFVFTDTKYPEIKIIKRDINHPEKLLPGATFKVTIDGGEAFDVTTGPDGTATIDYDTYGRFLEDNGTDELNFVVAIQEVRAPEGYLITDKGIHQKRVTRGDDLVVFEFDDMKYPEIWIRKLDVETGEPLAGMTFEVSIDGTEFSKQYQTVAATPENPEGWYKIRYEEFERFLGDIGGDVLDLRGYTVRVTEVEPPKHYNLDKQPGSVAGQEFTLTGQLQANQNHIEFTFEDSHYKNVKVRKIDSETGWGLKDAQFKLTSDVLDYPNDNKDAVSVTATTNADGWCYFYNLPNGWYYLEEIQAPIGYDIEGEWEGGDSDTGSTTHKSRKTRFYIGSDSGHTDVGDYGENIDFCQTCDEHTGSDGKVWGHEYNKRENMHWLTFTRKNDPMTGIRILKTDVYTGAPVAGARFKITPKAPLTDPPITVETNSEGVAVIENNLKAGTYEVQEIYVPKPYILDSTVHSIEVKNQHDAFELSLTNVAEGVLYIQKLDSVTGEPLAGAYFKITDADGKVIQNGNSVGPTDSSGFVMFSPLEPGKSYVVTEIKAPNGHIIDDHPQTFTVPENTSGYVKHLVFDNNPKANLWLKKIDAETGLPLQGAVFEITKGNGEIVKQNAITDAEGFIKVNGLDPGTYFAKETKAPDGYMLDETVHTIVLVSHSTEVFQVENRKPGGLSVRKVDAATGDALAGATFQLYDINDKPIGAPQTTGLDGYARWRDLAPGQYEVKETSAPEGYVLDSEPRKFEVKDFKSIEYVWKNVQNATITIYKKDGETKVPLAGAEFEIHDVNGKLVSTLITDINGSATSERLPLGWYQIIETKAPDGYQMLEEKSQPIEVKAGTPTVIERYNYSDKIIIIQKRDALTKDPLPGAWFELRDIKGNIIQEQFQSDASGVATSKPVEPGTYWLAETRAPEGYVLNEEPVKIVVEEGQSTRITFDNMPKTIIQIYKTDKYTGEPIMGVEFAIADKHGKIIELVQTDKTGWAYSQVLQPGDYIVTETKTVQGYGLDKTEHRVEVEDGRNYTLRLTNEPGVPIYIVKVDKDTQKPLAGAKFELRYDNGHGDCAYIGTYITDEYGRITTEPMMPGFYMLKEIEAPKGYAILEEETRLCVKAPDENGASQTVLNEFWIENQELPVLIVKKVDSSDGSPVQGAVFRLETADGDLIGFQETDHQGEAVWYHLNPGHYIVTEVESPEDYDLTNCPSKTINVELGKRNYVEFKDTPYGSLKITLQDKETSDYLKNGEFVIIDLKTMLEVTTFRTDVTGTFVIGSLAPGWYEVTQKYPPDGYTLLETVIKVEIKAAQQSTIHFYNTTAGMVIEKADAENPDKLLSGARFKVTRVTDAQVIGEYDTDQSGTVLVGGLTPGIYTVEEIVAPTGYEISEKPKNVDIHNGATAHVTFLDSANASITIHVVDKDTKDPIPGVKVEVWQQNGNLVNSWVSDKTGMIETEKMAPGYYILKVVDLVTGYTLETKEVTVELKAAKEVTYTFECKSSGSIIVSGKDDEGQLVGGIKFQILDINGKVIGTYTTGADGTFTLPNLAPGWYTAVIVENKTGYECGSMSQKFEVTANGSATIEFIHKRVSTLNVSAVDVDTQLGLNGVRFELWQQNGDKVGEYTTDKTGVVTINNVAMGMYVLKLVGSVDGYVAVKTEITVAITDNRVISQKFEFVSNSTLTVESKDANGFVANMKFKLTDLNGTLIGEYNTGDEGQVIIRDLKPGWYLVIETTAPDGFDMPSTTEQRVEIKAGSAGKITFMHESKGRVEIIITDDAKKPVADAVFELVDSNGKVIKSVTTDATGKLVITGVASGSYTVRLVSVSEQYTLSSKTEYTITVNSGMTVTQEFTVIATGNLTVTSKDGSGALIAGMKFEIRTIEGVLVGNYTTESNGSYIIKNLKPGWYIITETTAPDGLEIDKAEQRIEITNSGMFTVEFTHKSLSDLVIDVIDKDTREPVSGVTLELWVSNGDLVNKYVSSASGEIRITAIANGNYVLKVTSVPEGFTAVKTEININITSNRNITETVELISAGTLAVRSEDNAGNLIANMSFTVKTAAGELVGSFKTDSTGIYVITGLKPGEYVITEDSAPENWNIDEANREIRVQVSSSKRVDVTFKHIASSNVTVDVVNNGEPVNGAVVELWHQNGSSMVATWTTDYTGKIVINNISAGVYILKLTKYPDTMVPSQTEITIEITQNQSLNYKFELSSNGTLTVISADDEGKRLPGMSFEIRDLNETLIGSYTTDQNGEYKFDNFAPGWYIITETVAPGEFNITEETKSQRVEVKVGQHLDVTFTHGSKSDLVVKAVDSTGTLVAGVTFELYIQNGDLLNSYTTEADGTITIRDLTNGYYVLKMKTAPEGYKFAQTEYTVQITSGRTITLEVELVQNGILKVQSVGTDGTFIGGMQFTVKTLEGTPIVNGTTTETAFTVGATGEFIFTTLQPGWYIITETKAPDGYNIKTETQEQRIEIKAGAVATVKFEHVKTFGLQIRTTVAQTGAVIAGATYEIANMDGLVLKTVTSGEEGIAFADLTPGWYVITPKTAPDGYVFTDANPKNVEVKGDALTVIDMTVTQLSSIRVKVVNGTTGAPVYNVRIQLKNGDNVISEYYTDNEGYITLDKSVIAGGFKIEMIAVPDGYILDTIPKSISVENGATTEIVWKIYNEGGQIQVEVKSAADNVTLDKPAGSVLSGAVFEITNPDTYQVVATMISDARGIAASPALPIGRYIVKMVAAPAFYGLNESWSEEVRIKINNDVVRVNATCPSVTLGASITQKTNTSAKAGSNIRVDILTADSKSDVRLDNFYIHIKVPTDAARIVSLNPGKWNKPVWYKISYKTNANDYRKLAENLNSENNYTYDLSTQSLGLQSGEYVTDVRFEFGTVPAGFAMVSKTTYGLYIQGVPNGYKMINRLEMGGQHSATVLTTNHITNLGGVANIPAELAQSVIGGGEAVLAGSTGQWVTNTSIWTTTIKNTSTLPKTGY